MNHKHRSDRIGTGRAEHRGWNHVRDTRAPTAERGAGNEYASGQSGTERNAESREEKSRAEKSHRREKQTQREEAAWMMDVYDDEDGRGERLQLEQRERSREEQRKDL